MRKLRSTRGETLIETLVATLIIALSSILLLSMAVTATTINKRSEEASKLYQAELAAAEIGADISTKPNGDLTIEVKDVVTYEYKITFSSIKENELNSYLYDKGATP